MPHHLDQLPTWLLGRAHLRAHAIVRSEFTKAGSDLRLYEALADVEAGRPADPAPLAELVDLGFARGGDRGGITALGVAELVRLDAVVVDIQHTVFARLTGSERRTLVDLLSRLA